MKVRDLITALGAFDPDMEVMVPGVGDEKTIYADAINFRALSAPFFRAPLLLMVSSPDHSIKVLDERT